MAGISVSAVELTADCDSCGLEGGVVEVYDALVAACRFGLPSTTHCKLCAYACAGSFDRAPPKPLKEIPSNRCPACLHELTPTAIDDRCCVSCGARAALLETKPPLVFEKLEAFEAALDAWAEREKFPSRDALVNATFAEPDISKLFTMLQKKEPLEILADPFANMGVRTTGGKGGSARREEATRTVPDPRLTKKIASSSSPPPLQEPPPHSPSATPNRAADFSDLSDALPPRSAPPRAIVFPIVSVIAADGEIHPSERALIDRFLRSEGLPPLTESELCVHHPSEVAHFVPKERREDVVKLMCETAAVDGMPDESERRVIRAYATAWGVDDEKLEFWMWGYESMNTSVTRQLWLKIRRFVLSARWSEEEIQRRAGTTEPL